MKKFRQIANDLELGPMLGWLFMLALVTMPYWSIVISTKK